ncbi:4'-phosphopantetheinyl transferase family protein [Flavobacterium cellulosilyticum]|uniref:4-phosphopantetheinyl transferase family protein n=1 Tax=Flavobacterium cellulosilyticum TaxID=2541731 RepID=A0A4R5C574_9FLAO|nr:4'-phosphopantetheinyl transferase superfamily protein [Flavobacterium cellulosilyticum]TDD94881.1 4-phosphopantetheinyl transferase family protein [Flavobacterium cellulosilyticum]
MIGNDIVDLALAQKDSNWRRHGFLDKIFTEKEQLLILKSEYPETMVWNLWSRKEASYKIYNRQTQKRGYFPLQLECFTVDIINDFYYGNVIINEQIYFTKTEITSQYINTIAVLKVSDFDSIQFLKSNTAIQKDNGLPFYRDPKNAVLKPVSISHHGRFEQIVCI